MKEIILNIKNKTVLRRIAGLAMVFLGLILYLIPLLPGSWAIVIGLEILGVRLLVVDMVKEWIKHSRLFKKK